MIHSPTFQIGWISAAVVHFGALSSWQIIARLFYRVGNVDALH
jgi:hypothetical protein